MPEFFLHVLPIPEDSQAITRDDLNRAIASAGVLDSDVPDVQSIAPEPGERLLGGQYRGQYAEIMASQLRELINNGGYADVPLFGRNGSTPVDGYYVIAGGNVQRAKPQAAELQQFDLRVRRKGTRKDHWRAHATALSDIATANPYAADETVLIGAPGTATAARWFDETAGTLESASVDTTRTGEHIDADLYDAEGATFADPTLLFDLAYDDEGKTDCVVWDDRGNASKTDGNGTVQWGRVYQTSHEFEGAAIVQNELLRLTFDESGNALSAETWDSGSGSYTSVSLNAASWQLFDFDLTRIGPARIEAQVLFEDTGTNELYPVDMTLPRGYTTAVWTQAANESDRITYESFEDGDISEYSGDTGSFSVGSASDARDGDNVLTGTATTGGSSNSIASTTGLSDYPESADKVWRVWMKAVNSGQETAFGWFAQAAASNPDGYYIFQDIDSDQIRFEIRQSSSNTILDATNIGDADLVAGEWFRTDIQFHGNDYTVSTFDTDGNLLAGQSLTATSETTFTSGGIVFRTIGQNTGADARWDYLHNPFPGGLYDRLEPIASAINNTPGGTQTLVEREAVRR